MNSVMLTGRATKDLELRYTATGKAVATGTIAVRRSYKNSKGEYDSDFFNIVIWGKAGEVLAKYVNKGDFFGVKGELTTRNYENSEGRRVYVTEVNVTGFDFPVKASNGKGNSQKPNAQQQNSSSYPPLPPEPPGGFGGYEISDGDLPF